MGMCHQVRHDGFAKRILSLFFRSRIDLGK